MCQALLQVPEKISRLSAASLGDTYRLDPLYFGGETPQLPTIQPSSSLYSRQFLDFYL